MPATAHHRSNLRLSSSRLTREISNINASPWRVASTCSEVIGGERLGHVHRPAAPVAVHGQVRVRAVQLARPAATVLARATPQVVMKRAAQRQRRIVNARRQPPPEREQLPLAQL